MVPSTTWHNHNRPVPPVPPPRPQSPPLSPPMSPPGHARSPSLVAGHSSVQSSPPSYAGRAVSSAPSFMDLHDNGYFPGEPSISDLASPPASPEPFEPDDPHPNEDYAWQQSPIVHVDNLLRHHDLDEVARHIYTTAIFQKATGLSDTAIEVLLQQMFAQDQIANQGQISEHFTTRFRTIKSRLGVDPDQYIDRYIVCPNNDCWQLYNRDRLPHLESPACTNIINGRRRCDGQLYTTNAGMRTPIKVIPYTKLSTGLAMLMQDPNVTSKLNLWREAEPDIDLENDQSHPFEWGQPLFDREAPLRGLPDGSAWRSSRSDVLRVVDVDGMLQDVPTTADGGGRHSGLRWPLKIVINCDWYVRSGSFKSPAAAVLTRLGCLLGSVSRGSPTARLGRFTLA